MSRPCRHRDLTAGPRRKRLDWRIGDADDGYDGEREKGDVVRIGDLSRTATRVARGAGSVTSAVARHALWYLRYQVDGTSRARRERRQTERSSER
jgi:hypothetical protein